MCVPRRRCIIRKLKLGLPSFLLVVILRKRPCPRHKFLCGLVSKQAEPFQLVLKENQDDTKRFCGPPDTYHDIPFCSPPSRTYQRMKRGECWFLQRPSKYTPASGCLVGQRVKESPWEIRWALKTAGPSRGSSRNIERPCPCRIPDRSGILMLDLGIRSDPVVSSDP